MPAEAGHPTFVIRDQLAGVGAHQLERLIAGEPGAGALRAHLEEAAGPIRLRGFRRIDGIDRDLTLGPGGDLPNRDDRGIPTEQDPRHAPLLMRPLQEVADDLLEIAGAVSA